MTHDPDPIDLRLLLTFEAVARNGSVTAAARELGRTQSAISHRLKGLEDDLGVPVFERRGPRLQLTDYGERLRALCADLVGRSKHIRGQLLGEVAPEGHVTVGTHQALASQLFPQAARDILRDCPKLCLEYEFGFVHHLLDGLRCGRVDFVVSGNHHPPEEFSARCLGPNPLVAALPIDADPTLGPWVTPAELRAKAGRYLAYGGPPDTVFDAVGRFCQAERLVDAWCPRIPSIEVVRSLVELGAGYSLLPEYSVRQAVSLGTLRIADVHGLEPGAPLQLYKRRTAVETPALQLVEAALVEGITKGLRRPVE